MESWLDEITVDMLPEIYRYIADEIGIEAFLKLTKVAGGTTIYIPKQDTFKKQIRNIKIKQEYNGYNSKELALKYNMSVKWIQEICESDKMAGQMNLFD